MVAALIAGSAGGAALLLGLATPGVARPRPEVEPPAALRRVGTYSCAARGCHGAVGLTSPASGDVFIDGGASTTWRYYDPHNRSFEVLREPRSVRMAASLKAILENKPAHESKICLACHATVDPPGTVPGARIDIADGVSCEACHGPAEVWQETHLADAWRKNPAAKLKDGLVDLSDAAARAKECTSCHVGNRSRGMDVNHDLIAAGHPRLNFEYSAYLEAYPKHWREKPSTVASMAEDWAVGQAVTARAALQLLADRAESSMSGKSIAPAAVAPWPELSEAECFSCHHSLAKPAWNPDRGPLAVSPGRLPWATWTSAMLPELEKVRPGWKLDGPGSPWAALRAEMSKKEPDAGKVHALAVSTVRLIDGWLKAPKGEPLTGPEVVSMAKRLAEGWPSSKESWDQLAQRTLAIEAMGRAGRALVPASPEWKGMAESIGAARWKLGFPTGFDSPLGGRPAADPGH